MFDLSSRQIHLDFHTSELIPDVGAEFDPTSFAKTAKESSINSMTVFARCHHGWLYYPSKKFPELVHPTLKNSNLLLEQVRALHKEGIKAPVYITVQFDYHAATTHPEWLVRKKDGSHEGDSFTEPGFYQCLCVNTGYYDFLAEVTKEVCQILGDELDGLFFDIVSIHPCLCASCRAEMKDLGIPAGDDNEVYKFAKFALTRFKHNLTELIRTYSSCSTIFYNAGHIGPEMKESFDDYTHFELESLPSGSWGYLHFPVAARYARTLGKDCLGMTGKFHTDWGDFHSLKNLAALEFECMRILSYGFACSIGDQLEPNGKLNPAAYSLIQNVYSQYEACEAWARPSKALVESAIVTSEKTHICDTVMGASQLLEELTMQFDIIDKDMDLSQYKLLFLPDDLIVTEDYQKKLDEYVKNGGSILACGQGGLSEDGKYPSCFGIIHEGKSELYPDFLIPEGAMAKGLVDGNEYVIYMQGEKITSCGAQTLLSARSSYFNREGDKFCSHKYTPSAKSTPYPAVTKNGQVIVFSHPIFGQYRNNAPFWCKQLIANTIDMILENRLVRHNGPSTMTISLLHQPEKRRINAFLLCYVPVRKSATIDIIEERTKLSQIDLNLSLPYEIKSAKIVPSNVDLPLDGQNLTIPEIDGYTIVELSY